MKKMIWIGRYESDIMFSKKLFFASITYYGSNSNGNYSFYPKYTDLKDTYESKTLFVKFVYKCICTIKKELEHFSLYFYDPCIAYMLFECDLSLKNYTICLNPYVTINWLQNKSLSRVWAAKDVKILPFILESGKNCNYKYIKEFFPAYNEFIIQENISEGGEGTFILTEDKSNNVLDSNELYHVSPYFKKGISLNANLIINSSNVLYFPLSQQILYVESNNLIYKGSDYLAPNKLTDEEQEKIYAVLKLLGKELSNLGYKGICGIDLLLYNNECYFIEINPRFQGSSFLIDSALQDKYGKSLYELNIEMFYNENFDFDINNIKKLKIPFAYINSSNRLDNNKYNFDPINCIIESNKKDGKFRYLFNSCLDNNSITYDTNDYYNYFANIYNIILPDWEADIQTEGKIIKKILAKYTTIPIVSILDCMCGIGIQTMSLALEGFQVYGSDISHKEILFAKKEASRRGLDIEYQIADCKNLSETFSQKFDAIIAMDNAMPHLLSEKNFVAALKSIYNQLNDNGVFLASFRNYDEILKTKPISAYPPRRKYTSTATYTILKMWNWENDICTSDQYVIEDTKNDHRIYYNTYKQWAITKEALFAICKKIPFRQIYWLLESETNYYQPIVCLVK